MSDNKSRNATLQLEEISIIASVAQLSLIVLTVVYSSENPDLWDLAIAVFVIFIGLRFRNTLWHSPIARTLAVAGLAISAMIIIQFTLFYTSLWEKIVTAIVDGIKVAILNKALITGLVDSAVELFIVGIFYVIIYFLLKQTGRQRR